MAFFQQPKFPPPHDPTHQQTRCHSSLGHRFFRDRPPSTFGSRKAPPPPPPRPLNARHQSVLLSFSLSLSLEQLIGSSRPGEKRPTDRPSNFFVSSDGKLAQDFSVSESKRAHPRTECCPRYSRGLFSRLSRIPRPIIIAAAREPMRVALFVAGIECAAAENQMLMRSLVMSARGVFCRSMRERMLYAR